MNFIRKYGNHKKRRMFNRIFLTSFSIAVSVLLILGLFSNAYTTRVVRDQANKADTIYLKQVSNTIDRQLYDIQINVMSLLDTPYFSREYRNDLDEAPDAVEIANKVLPMLNAFLVNNKYLDDLSLYIKGVGLISPNQGLNRPDMIPDLELLELQMRGKTQSKWYDGVFSYRVAYGTRSGVTLLNKFPYASNSEPIGLMIATINPRSIKDSIVASEIYDGQFMTILSESGNRIATTSAVSFPKEFDLQLRDDSRVRDQFEYVYDRTEYFVSAYHSAYTHWTYFDIIPVKELNQEARGILVMTLSIIAVLLLLAAVAALLGSVWSYRPFKRLLGLMRREESGVVESDDIGYALTRWEEVENKTKELKMTTKELEDRLTRHAPMLRETVTLQLLQGHLNHYDAEQLEELLKRYELKLMNSTCVLTATFDRSEHGVSKFQHTDKDLILFAMKNIVNELLETGPYNGIAAHLPNDTLAVLIWLSEPEENNELRLSDMEQAAEQLRAICENYLRLPVTVGLGGIAKQASEVPVLYERAIAALEARIIYGRNQVLYDADPSGYSGRYPIELESRYESALKLGSKEDAVRMLIDFSNYVKANVVSADGVQTFYNQWLAATLRTAYALQIDVTGLLEGHEPYTIIQSRSSIEDLNEWFIKHYIQPITDNVLQLNQRDYSEMVDQAISFIRREYARDISLEECAEYCQVSKAHLTRYFRKITGMSFLEYVTKHRIEQSKDLLLNTDLPISTISEMIGYQRINFMRVFKKTEGMTPGQYRESRQRSV
ncbi:helix-turn-helix domain-containing protein [Cohnella thailandensis]|uniref:AraC family transcriptional regulator n=1 Tax=Cohnella thailandensis TaxID=557557 RepID=A0A841SSY8_9BACL|nr:helix-turn-helix domain-containing protein [Cohnella thailandensis]MBB6635054.1 AraC family transcriptional regulator [Cohnella thailandensis]MBP1975722.1 AraC-like DNA-binding protein [Cohnella thailandensis]